jgi:ribosomal protein L6P/L9E
VSRIGKKPISIPEKVDVKIDGAKVSVKGPKGSLEKSFIPKGITIARDKGVLNVVFPLPAGISATVDPKQTKITLAGIDKELLGQTAANLRSKKPPEPYKGKGIKYAEERVRIKEGKAGAS